MPKYDVVVCGTLEISTTINVSAENEEAAENKALARVQEMILEWTVAETNKKAEACDWEEENLDWQVDSVTAEE